MDDDEHEGGMAGDWGDYLSDLAEEFRDQFRDVFWDKDGEGTTTE